MLLHSPIYHKPKPPDKPKRYLTDPNPYDDTRSNKAELIRMLYPDRVNELTDSLDTANIILYRNVSESCAELIEAAKQGKCNWAGFNMEQYRFRSKAGKMWVFWPCDKDKPSKSKVHNAIRRYRPLPLDCLIAHYYHQYSTSQTQRRLDWFAIN